MSEAQRICEKIMWLQNTVPTDGFKAYNDRQLQIAILQHRLAAAIKDTTP